MSQEDFFKRILNALNNLANTDSLAKILHLFNAEELNNLRIVSLIVAGLFLLTFLVFIFYRLLGAIYFSFILYREVTVRNLLMKEKFYLLGTRLFERDFYRKKSEIDLRLLHVSKTFISAPELYPLMKGSIAILVPDSLWNNKNENFITELIKNGRLKTTFKLRLFLKFNVIFLAFEQIAFSFYEGFLKLLQRTLCSSKMATVLIYLFFGIYVFPLGLILKKWRFFMQRTLWKEWSGEKGYELIKILQQCVSEEVSKSPQLFLSQHFNQLFRDNNG